MRLVNRATATAVSLPAPVGGWNARDAWSNMEPDDATDLINWFPRPSDVMIRFGYSNYATGLGSQVESLMVYNGPVSIKMFAAAGTSFYDVTNTGAVGAAVQTALTNARWESQNVSTSGGNYMYCVNGLDSPRLYDGTNWTTITGVSTPAITGVTTSNLVNVNLFKNRLYFIEKSSLRAWYLPTQSIGGAASLLDMSTIARFGGHLVSMATWTIDAGEGVDDLAVFITSQGEFIVYKGSDPASAATWALVGVWKLGSPIGTRCQFKYAGDVLALTMDGLLPLGGALQSSRVNPRVALTDKIQQAVSDATTNYANTFGWQIIYYPKVNMLLLNVPVAVGSQEQYVMNTITKSWGRFQKWPANCFAIYNDNLYFGGNGVVGQAWNTNSDNSISIVSTAKQAYNYFGTRGQLKRWTMMRPVFRTSGNPTMDTFLNVDFADSSNYTLSTPVSIPYGIWDSSLWDSGLWGQSLSVINLWRGTYGVGYCASPVIVVQTTSIETHWMSTDLVMERGGIL